MSSSGSDSPSSSLEPKDLRALTRLIARSRGATFKLAVVEISSPAAVASLCVRLAQERDLERFEIINVILRPLEGRNLWSELKERAVGVGKPALLFLSAVEMPTSSQDTQQLFRQLNVQRDLFVRDLPFPWVVFIHPEVSNFLRNIAPDFCDFVSLWLKTVDEAAPRTAAPLEIRKAFNYEAGALPGSAGTLRAYLTSIDILMADGRFAEADDVLARAALVASSPEERARVALWRVRWLRSTGRFAEAAGLARDQLSISPTEIEEQGVPFPVLLLLELGTAQRALGDLAGARSSLEKAEALQRRDVRPYAYSITVLSLLDVLLDQNDLPSARGYLDMLVALDDVPSKAKASALYALGRFQLAEGDLDAAQLALEHSLSFLQDEPGPVTQGRAASTLRALARVERGKGRIDEAQATLQRAAQTVAREGDEYPLAAAGIFHDLGVIALESGNLDAARSALDRALEIELRVLGGEHPSSAATLHTLGALAARKGSFKEARELLERALKGHPPDSVNAAITSVELAILSMGSGDLDRARHLLDDVDAKRARFQSLELDQAAIQARSTLDRMLGNRS